MQRGKNNKSLYLSGDMVALRNAPLTDILVELQKSHDITHVFIDEIHFINNRQGHLKNIYDFTSLSVVFSGSSNMDIVQ